MKTAILLTFCGFLCISSLNHLVAETTFSPIISTNSGPIRGRRLSLTSPVYEFTGIPFAEPPVGSLRFKKPVAKAPWSSTFDAVNPAKTCTQLLSGNVFLTGQLFTLSSDISEDCLQLNIWVPASVIDQPSNAQQLPVFLFIYGGGFISGLTMGNIYNGSVLANKGNIIVASINYRVGTLGFAFFEDGTNEAAPANVGMWDQVEGMKWIHDNIEAFGGSSTDITLAGESAGASSVALHLLSPHSRLYFHRAVLESGSATAPWAVYTQETAIQVTNMVVDEVGQLCSPSVTSASSLADKMTCLRSVDAIELSKADLSPLDQGYGFGAAPTVDGDFLPDDPQDMMSSGNFHKVPLLLGVTSHEGSWFYTLDANITDFLPSVPNEPADSYDILTSAHYDELLIKGLRLVSGSPEQMSTLQQQNAVLEHYRPPSLSGKPIIDAGVQSTGDYGFTCPTFDLAEVASRHSVDVYAYVLSHISSVGAATYATWLGVQHGEDLIYIFGEPFSTYTSDWGYQYYEHALSELVIKYIVNFAWTGNPNNMQQSRSYLPTWPTFENNLCSREVLNLNAQKQLYRCNDKTICDYKKTECQFWGKLLNNSR